LGILTLFAFFWWNSLVSFFDFRKTVNRYFSD
jgi:hypothetical protein